MKQLGDQLRANPNGQFRTMANGLERVASMRYAVLDVKHWHFNFVRLLKKSNFR